MTTYQIVLLAPFATAAASATAAALIAAVIKGGLFALAGGACQSTCAGAA